MFPVYICQVGKCRVVMMMNYKRESYSGKDYKEPAWTYGSRETTSKGSETNTIKTPALGRPFRLGMLYDRVNDTILPGETVLTMEEMENHTFKKKKTGSSFEVIYGDSLESKSAVYKGDANLEVNVLFGIMSLGSSGKFLKDKTSSKKQLRVSLTAEHIMLYEELEMKQFLSKISNTKTNATHIVSAIEYGTNVTFTFDRTLSNDEDELQVKGELKTAITCIPGFSVSGKAEMGIKNIDKQKAENISCKFYGDIILPVNPTTYEEAVRVYKELPTYLKEDEAVPVSVWLHPIPKEATLANKVLQVINKENMKQAVIALDDLQGIYISCNDLMSGQAFAHIPEVQCKLDQFRRTVQTFQEEFQDQVVAKLLKEDDTSNVSKWHDSIDDMKRWISGNAEIEINLLDIYINEIKKSKIEVLSNSGVDAKLFEHDLVIILDISLPFSSGQYMKKESRMDFRYPTQLQQSKILEASERHDTETTPSSAYTEVNRWYRDAKIKAFVRHKIKSFLTLTSTQSRPPFELFVTFTDRNDSDLHNKKPYGVRLVPYKDGEETKETNLFGDEADEMLKN